MKMSDAFDEARRRKELADAATAQPATIVTQRPGAETTTGTAGMEYDSDTGQYVPKFMGSDGQPTEQAQTQLNATPEAPSAPLETALPTFATETSQRYRMGDKEQAQPFTPAQIGMQRARSMSDVALRHGDPVQAARFETLAATRRDTADQEEIRSTLDGTAPVGLSHVRPFVNDKGGAPMSVQGDAANPAAPGMQRQGSYLETVGPRVMDAYLKQGKIAEAKAWRDFTESEGGRAYANDFAQAQRLVTVGDYDTAAPVLERLYNRGYPDGRQAKLTSVGDGNFKLDVFDQKSGELLGSKTMPAPDMGKMAISALAPTKLVEFMAQQQGKREAEGSTLNRQLEIERLRQEGADVRDDRREERLQTRLDAQSANLERRLSATGGLSVPQQRTNDAIDAARKQLEGMSPAEIL
ncbi:MAG: hypothetical protein NT083_00360, partial [Rhodocyclales bacterium]|nr:hypothetical protein [Rhodocyclales bacterium]